MIRNNKLLNAVTIVSILIFLVFIALSKVLGVGTYTMDSMVFIIMIIIAYLFYDAMNLNIPLYTFGILSLIPHNAGVFGFYLNSPVAVQWDHITHFLPMMAAAMIVFNFLSKWMDSNFFTRKNIFLIFIAVLAALGAGSLIENVEFMGFSMFGFGEGAFFFGTGDAAPGEIVNIEEAIEAHGGGWFNTMYDLVANLLGALLGVIFMCISQFVIKKNYSPSPNIL